MGPFTLQPGSSYYGQLTSIFCPDVSFKSLEPRGQDIKLQDLWIIWMECLSDSDTEGNKDEIGSTCLKLMGMDCVQGDVEPHFLEATARARTWAAAAKGDRCLLSQKAVTHVTRLEVDRKGPEFTGPETAVNGFDHAAAHPLFFCDCCSQCNMCVCTRAWMCL